MSIRVLVTGGRSYSDAARVNEVLDGVHKERGIHSLVHGGASGADSLAGVWARSCGVLEIRRPADWRTYGKSAGPRRNAEMLRDHKPDLVVAFKGGNGTKNMVELARAANVEILEVDPAAD
jgi:hypothetical protein